jgi:hypothetical protein
MPVAAVAVSGVSGDDWLPPPVTGTDSIIAVVKVGVRIGVEPVDMDFCCQCFDVRGTPKNIGPIRIPELLFFVAITREIYAGGRKGPAGACR